jgi:hypothetical protein
MEKSTSKIHVFTLRNNMDAFEGIEMKLDALYISALDEGQ